MFEGELKVIEYMEFTDACLFMSNKILNNYKKVFESAENLMSKKEVDLPSRDPILKNCKKLRERCASLLEKINQYFNNEYFDSEDALKISKEIKKLDKDYRELMSQIVDYYVIGENY